MKEADGFVLRPGGFGTMDEAFELLTLIQTGKAQPGPIVLLDVPGGTYWKRWVEFIRSELLVGHYISDHDLSLVTITDDCDEAVEHISGFFRNFHSQRYVDGNLVLRLRYAPSDSELETINRDFVDIVVRDGITHATASKAEVADPDVPELARIKFRFDRRSHARLRELIDYLNALPATP